MWRQITASTTTIQQALQYDPTDTPLDEQADTASVLYCVALNGEAGTIVGAPASLLLPPNSTFSIESSAQIVLPAIIEHTPIHKSMPAPFDATTSVRASAAGVAVIAEHDMLIYQPGSELNVGGGFQFQYLRPGEKSHMQRAKFATPTKTGCTVSFTNDAGEITHVAHYKDSCFATDLAKAWSGVTSNR